MRRTAVPLAPASTNVSAAQSGASEMTSDRVAMSQKGGMRTFDARLPLCGAPVAGGRACSDNGRLSTRRPDRIPSDVSTSGALRIGPRRPPRPAPSRHTGRRLHPCARGTVGRQPDRRSRGRPPERRRWTRACKWMHGAAGVDARQVAPVEFRCSTATSSRSRIRRRKNGCRVARQSASGCRAGDPAYGDDPAQRSLIRIVGSDALRNLRPRQPCIEALLPKLRRSACADLRRLRSNKRP